MEDRKVIDTVHDVKDTNFWKQFTTETLKWTSLNPLFTMSKIQIFESNSQLRYYMGYFVFYCSRCQRYKFLKAIHNNIFCVKHIFKLFTMSKIQIFESNSQRWRFPPPYDVDCSRCQRYKFLKAIHNAAKRVNTSHKTVHDVKDTNFWKQFTTISASAFILFDCSRCQRYKFLKAIHNIFHAQVNHK